jgi:anthranilate synthase component 1
MEIIAALEEAPRGPYGGAVLRLGLGGDLDSCITIRTVVYEGKVARVTAGAGIVHLSVPETEYAECLSKARAALTALGVDCAAVWADTIGVGVRGV